MFVGRNVFLYTIFVFSDALFRNWLHTSAFLAFHKLHHVVLLKSLRRYYSLFSCHRFCSLINITLQTLYNIVGKKSKIYFTTRYSSLSKFPLQVLAVIVGKSLISAGLDIDRILHFVFYDKILQIYQQHWVRKFCRHILSKYWQI